MYMVFQVIDNPEFLNEVLQAWEKAGIRGITILESTGLHRARRRFIPMRYASSLSNLEENHMTLMAIVTNESLVQAALAASEEIIGDMNAPNTGFFASWKIDFAKGMEKPEQ